MVVLHLLGMNTLGHCLTFGSWKYFYLSVYESSCQYLEDKILRFNCKEANLVKSILINNLKI